jgi:hypothetical protein
MFLFTHVNYLAGACACHRSTALQHLGPCAAGVMQLAITQSSVAASAAVHHAVGDGSGAHNAANPADTSLEDASGGDHELEGGNRGGGAARAQGVVPAAQFAHSLLRDIGRWCGAMPSFQVSFMGRWAARE